MRLDEQFIAFSGVSDSKPFYLPLVSFFRVLYYDEESVNKNEDSKRPLVSVIYKMSGDGNQKGR